MRASGDGSAVRLGGLAPSAGAAASLVGAGVALWLLAAPLLGVRAWPGGPGGDSGSLRLPAAPAAPAPRVPAARADSVRLTVAPVAAATPAAPRAVAHRRH